MLEEHLGYVGDRARLELFRAAVGNVLTPGASVVDVGCGTGILGLICLKAGAARLYAIDSTAMIDVARESLSRAGFAARTVFLRGRSDRIVLPELIDVAICDHVGYFGFDYGIVHTMRDVRRRFLKPGGAVIPSRISLKLAAVESEKCGAKVEGWRGEAIAPEFHWLRQHAVNTKHPVELMADELLGPPADLGSISLAADSPDFFRWTAELQIARDGVMCGIAGWFQCELADGIWMTNSPLSDVAIDRPQVFLPTDEAIEVKAGDRLLATVMTRPADNVIAWVIEVPATGRCFRQSTWQSLPLGRQEITQSRSDRVPHVSREAEARMTVLGYCDGRRTMLEIERTVLRDHPDLFPSPEETSRFVAQVLSRDTE